MTKNVKLYPTRTQNPLDDPALHVQPVVDDDFLMVDAQDVCIKEKKGLCILHRHGAGLERRRLEAKMLQIGKHV